MAFPQELLELAQQLATLRAEPHQASLRRAVSTAYYALFHLLVSEATANWAQPELRATLGRCFDHGPMKTASEAKISQINTAFKNNTPEGPEKIIALHLRTVANAFIQAQQKRNDADYNIAKEWTAVEVYTQIAAVSDAFESWSAIRDKAVAQAFLVSLLGSKDRRSADPKQPVVNSNKKIRHPRGKAAPSRKQGDHK
jgi:uncharacterized protein (UPF0332 family)